ncbi:hypothetical protein E4U43_003879 [Claviceps pusilla]|uniref:Uncharacterized protein n=1 Tax=Claviceps pusilla TaxID=123648 RepID=A0A9P7SUA7_9HYPO|nr:hypothetical protein E4U43_003879 [Claviceps pusilla]
MDWACLQTSTGFLRWFHLRQRWTLHSLQRDDEYDEILFGYIQGLRPIYQSCFQSPAWSARPSDSVQTGPKNLDLRLHTGTLADGWIGVIAREGRPVLIVWMTRMMGKTTLAETGPRSILAFVHEQIE